MGQRGLSQGSHDEEITVAGKHNRALELNYIDKKLKDVATKINQSLGRGVDELLAYLVYRYFWLSRTQSYLTNNINSTKIW